MDFIAIDFVPFCEFNDGAIDAGAQVALFHDGFKQLPVVTLATLDQRREYDNLLSGVGFTNQTGNLIVGIAHHFFARRIGIGF